MLKKGYLNCNPVGEGHIYSSVLSWEPQYSEVPENGRNFRYDEGSSTKVFIDDTKFEERYDGIYTEYLCKDNEGRPHRGNRIFF